MTTPAPKRSHPVAPQRRHDDEADAPRDSQPSDPRLRWPGAVVLCVIAICITLVLLFAEGDVKTALVSAIGLVGSGVLALLPSILAPKAGQ